MKLIYRAGAFVSGAALLGSTLVGVTFGDTTVDITGNGNNSTNIVGVDNSCTVDVLQKNKTIVNTDATVIASTGGNQANGNVGSGVTTTTGDPTASATINVGGSTNTADVPSCCECAQGTTDITVSGNGNKSVNISGVDNSATTTTTQRNRTRVKTTAKVKAKTGKNQANGNVGGTVGTSTGTAGAALDVTVTPSSNNL